MRTDDPDVHNKSQIHDEFPRSIDPGYTFGHAMYSQDPHIYKMPSEGDIPFAQLESLLNMLIDPDKSTRKWNNLQGHLKKHRHIRERIRQAQLRMMHQADVLLREAKTHLQMAEQPKLIPTIDAILCDRQVRRQDCRANLDYSYDNAAIEILRCYIDMRFALNIMDRPGSIEEFQLMIIYPDSSSTYAFSVTYETELIDSELKKDKYMLITGYSIGKSMEHKCLSGTTEQAIYLNQEPLISTVFGGFKDRYPYQAPPGSCCNLTVVNRPVIHSPT